MQVCQSLEQTCLEWQPERNVNTRTYCAEEEEWVTAKKIVSFYFMTKHKYQRNVLQSDTQSRWHFMCSYWGKMTLADFHCLVLVLRPTLQMKGYTIICGGKRWIASWRTVMINNLTWIYCQKTSNKYLWAVNSEKGLSNKQLNWGKPLQFLQEVKNKFL